MEGGDMVKDANHLLLAQDAGQSVPAFGIEITKEMPGALEHIDKEKLDAAIGNAQSARCPLVSVPAVEEVVLQVRLRDQVRGLAVMELNQ